MKKTLILLLSLTILVGCSNFNQNIKEYHVVNEIRQLQLTEIDISSLTATDKLILPISYKNNQFYFDMFESSCFVCTTIDISPNVHQYNTLTHEFSETPPTSLSISGIDFNKGIIMIDSIEQGTSYSQRLAFYDDKGLNTFYLANPEVERLRAVIGDEYIYLGIKLAAQDSFELINEKVITFDKNGNIVDELILPLELDEDSKHNQYYWCVYKGEV